MVKLWVAPWLTVTSPTGVMEPLARREAAMVKVTGGMASKLAAMVWSACTSRKS